MKSPTKKVSWHHLTQDASENSYVKSPETSKVAFVELQPNLYNLLFIMYNADAYNHMIETPCRMKERKGKIGKKKSLLGISSTHSK